MQPNRAKESVRRYNDQVASLEGFEKYFRVISYLVTIFGALSLFVSGAIGIALFAIFILVALLAWKLEDTRWQVSDKAGLVVIAVAIPLFIIDWRFHVTGLGARELFAASSLSKLILFVAALKLLQSKSDRDWVFIYLISFFEVLLAAGVSISPLYLASLLAFLLLTISAIIAFEIRKTSTEVFRARESNLGKAESKGNLSLRLSRSRLPVLALVLMVTTTVIAVPLFFTLPRVGGAGLTGGFAETTQLTGFSDSVQLGVIGKLQQNNQTVMRVRIDRNDNPNLKRLYWRGIALDRFENNTWKRTNQRYREPFTRTVGNRFVVDYARRDGALTVQTVYLEPLNTNILFTLARPIVISSSATEVSKDSEGGITAYPAAYDRTSYTVYSDTYVPPPDELRLDNEEYARRDYKYLVLPKVLDQRISQMATSWIRQENALTRYDIAKAVEKHLQNDFGYSLDMKAGGADPLADFLFNVREGHCEYFATAMAVMLRTQGIATRVVNGFSQGEYNDAADVYVVKQKNAHSWVEVYFPGEKIWVAFDPTPYAGQNPASAQGYFMGAVSKYMEALETFWIQYFVTYDDQEQRSLFSSLRSSARDYSEVGANWFNAARNALTGWWEKLRGDEGLNSSAKALGIGVGALLGASILVILLVWVWRRIAALSVWKRIAGFFRPGDKAVVVAFYARLQDLLEIRGFVRKPDQTPLEFAYATGLDEAVKITEKYNGVRFGEKKLTDEESASIETWLERMETTQ